MSNKHDGSAGGFGRSTERGEKGPRSQTERGKTRSSVVTQGAEAVPELCSRLSKLPRNSGLHLTILPHRSNEVLARREKARPALPPNAQKVPERATSAGRLSNEAPAACTALRGPKGEREESAEALSAEARERKKASPSRMYTR